MRRIWIYQADRFLSPNEVESIKAKVQNFVASWKVHGKDLSAFAHIVDNLFLILEVDQSVAEVSGCSIDKSVHFIKELGSEFGVDFFDRMKVSYIDNAGNLQLADRTRFRELVDSGAISDDTIVYNNLIQEAQQLVTNWKIPFVQSWHAKVFK